MYLHDSIGVLALQSFPTQDFWLDLPRVVPDTGIPCFASLALGFALYRDSSSVAGIQSRVCLRHPGKCPLVPEPIAEGQRSFEPDGARRSVSGGVKAHDRAPKATDQGERKQRGRLASGLIQGINHRACEGKLCVQGDITVVFFDRDRRSVLSKTIRSIDERLGNWSESTVTKWLCSTLTVAVSPHPHRPHNSRHNDNFQSKGINRTHDSVYVETVESFPGD